MVITPEFPLTHPITKPVTTIEDLELLTLYQIVSLTPKTQGLKGFRKKKIIVQISFYVVITIFNYRHNVITAFNNNSFVPLERNHSLCVNRYANL